MVELVDNLVAAYRERLEVLEWMSPDTRERALEKLAAFTPKIGYPDKWRDYERPGDLRRRPDRQRPAGRRCSRPATSGPSSAGRSTASSGS